VARNPGRRDTAGAAAQALDGEAEGTLLLVAPADLGTPQQLGESAGRAAGGLSVEVVTDPGRVSVTRLSGASTVLAAFQPVNALSGLLDQLRAARAQRRDGYPVLIIATALDQLTALGGWLYAMATAERLEGVRLIAAADFEQVLERLPARLGAVREANFLKMPVNPDVERSEFKYFFCLSPESRALVKLTRQLAENNITRLYVLGAPGAGKSSLAYYYYLCRGRGRYVSINLTSEATDEKAAMKSLLCGHVVGAFGDSGGREGALSMAQDGVCFLDESHGVSGVVMQVLMEVLDTGQYLPYGGTNKRKLDCAVLFASNRSWEHLRNLINLDEHARLGAHIVGVTDLKEREEDLVAVMSATLASFKRGCTTWHAPVGLTDRAWEAIRRCPWHGNVRSLIRVIETAAVECAKVSERPGLITAEQVRRGLDLWEPEDHHSLRLYSSA
jgi:transcriptional regulator with AAA-type ATPase domain